MVHRDRQPHEGWDGAPQRADHQRCASRRSTQELGDNVGGVFRIRVTGQKTTEGCDGATRAGGQQASCLVEVCVLLVGELAAPSPVGTGGGDLRALAIERFGQALKHGRPAGVTRAHLSLEACEPVDIRCAPAKVDNKRDGRR